MSWVRFEEFDENLIIFASNILSYWISNYRKWYDDYIMKKYNANSYCISSFRYPKLIKEYVLRLLKIAFKRTRSTYAYRNDKLPPRRFCAKCDNYCYYITCDSIWIIWHPYGSALFLILNSTLLGWLVYSYLISGIFNCI